MRQGTSFITRINTHLLWGLVSCQAVGSVPDAAQLELEWRGIQQVGCGLNNLGNTCYVNSILQCLTYLPPLGNFALRGYHETQCPLPPLNCAACLLERRIKRSLTGTCAEAPNNIVSRLDRQLMSQQFTRYRQVRCCNCNPTCQSPVHLADLFHLMGAV